MSENGKIQEQTQHLLQGPLKHIRAAALAAALVPLASIAAAPASAQETCGSAGNICGFVWNDADQDGIQDLGEPAFSGAVVSTTVEGTTFSTSTDGNGFYFFFVPPSGSYEIDVQIPPGTEPTTPNVGLNDALDSDGVPNGINSVATIVYGEGNTNTDFGFIKVVTTGTGTPGYWKNHPEAWPSSITVAGVTYTAAQAIAKMQLPDNKDKTLTLFSSLAAAMLNVWNGTESSCVAGTIADADLWMATYPAPVRAASLAWKLGEPLHRTLDNYNNGGLCAPHRD